MSRLHLDGEPSSTADYSTTASLRTAKRKYLTAPIVAAESLALAAILVGLFLLYQLKYTGVIAAREQDAALDDLENLWASETVTTGEELPGDVTAILRAGKLGNDTSYPVFLGTDQDTLAKGPGLYDGTQDFGENGNTAIAAHRDGWNAPFSSIDTLAVCDVIEIETRKAIYTYRVPSSSLDIAQRTKENEQCFNPQQTRALNDGVYAELPGTSIVAPTAVEVVWPVPLVTRDMSEANLSLLTLTSCHPHWSNAERYIVHAVNTEIKRKA